MKYILLIVLAVSCFMLPACRKSDIRTVTISVPEMKNEACVQRIGASIYKIGGINRESLVFDLSKRSITVTYDSMILARKNIEFAIAEAGFDANAVPANAQAAAALPDECR